MFGRHFFGGSGSGEWIAAGNLLLPFVVVAFLGGVLTHLLRRIGWLPTITSIAPIAVMLGALSYTFNIATYAIFTEGFAPRAIFGGLVRALIGTLPITLVLGPMLVIYILHLRKGRKILRDTTVFCVCFFCLVAEVVYLNALFADS